MRKTLLKLVEEEEEGLSSRAVIGGCKKMRMPK